MDFFLKTGIGQAIRRFLPPDSSKPCVIGGVIFDDVPGFNAPSDGDVIYHALCNAITSISGVPILCGGIADELCSKGGITDSQIYLEEALKTLKQGTITHVAIALEGKRPLIRPKTEEVRQNIARVLSLDLSQVGLTAVFGEGLTDCGCGEGMQAFAVITVMEKR